MNALRVLQVALCLVALGTFGWGMARFFRTTHRNAGAKLVGMLALVSAAWHVTAVTTTTIKPRRSLAAVALYSLSLAVFFWAVGTCRRESRTLSAIFESDTPRFVIREGPYRLVRHPFYSAYTLFWLAGWVASGGWLSLASAAAMTITYVCGARKEESKFRASQLSEDYADYRRQTGFMLPKP